MHATPAMEVPGYTFDKKGAISSYTWTYPQAGIHAFLGTTITI